MPHLGPASQGTDSVVRMLEWKRDHPSTEFDLSPSWFAARLPGHEPIGALTLGRLMDKLDALGLDTPPR